MSEGRRCLIIDDNRTLRKLIADALGAAGHELILADSLESALRSSGDAPFDCILLDLILPGMGRADGVRHTRNQWPKAGLVAMTAGDSSLEPLALLREANDAGADILLRKPFSAPLLLETVEDAFRIADGASAKGHVLLVDDSRTVLTFARHALIRAGYRVTHKLSMEDALSSLLMLQVDCVVTDVFMPGMGGIAGLEMVRRIWPDIAMVAMSGGLVRHMDREKALAAAEKVGARTVLPKPFTAEELVAAVQRARELKPAAVAA